MNTITSLSKSISVFSQTYKYLQLAERPGGDLHVLKSDWAKEILQHLHIDFKILGLASEIPSLLLVGNHISYLDIPLLIHSNPRISFVAKKEIQTWPVFGSAAQKIQTVFVERESGTSRRRTREAIHQGLDQGKQIAIFPSGTTSLSESKLWKKGVFEIAAERDSWIQPFRISYSPLRTAAYIDQDIFPLHLYQLSQKSNIQARLEFHEPIKVTRPLDDCLRWQYWSRGLLEN